MSFAEAALASVIAPPGYIEVAVPEVTLKDSPISRAFRWGKKNIILSIADGCWHLSISTPDRLPTWEELKQARYDLVPDRVTMAMLLPPKEQYVNVHPFCFHLWEIDPNA